MVSRVLVLAVIFATVLPGCVIGNHDWGTRSGGDVLLYGIAGFALLVAFAGTVVLGSKIDRLRRETGYLSERVDELLERTEPKV